MSRPTRVLSSDSINIFTILALVFFPVDAFPLIFPTDYRPLSFLFIIPVFLLIVLNSIYKRKLDRAVSAGILALIGFSIVSLMVTRHAQLGLGGFIDFFITFAIGISTFAVFRYTFIKVRNKTANNDEYTKVIIKYLTVGCMLMIFVGIIELLALYTPLLPTGLKTEMNLLFAGKTSNRLQLLAREPSWAARQALFGLPVLLISKGRFSIWTILLFLLALLTFSLEGLVVMVLSFALYVVYKYRQKKMVLIYKMLTAAVGVGVVFALVFVLARNIFFKENQYFYSRIDRLSKVRLSELNVSNVIYIDESVFVRVASPMIGIFMFLDHPVFGAGGGNFRYYYGKYIREKFPRALNQEQYHYLRSQIRKKRDQGKNLYTRVLGEFGILGAFVFIILIRELFAKLRAVDLHDVKIKNYLYLWLFICLVSLLQFDSLAYVNFWLLVAFLLSLTSKERPSKVRETA